MGPVIERDRLGTGNGHVERPPVAVCAVTIKKPSVGLEDNVLFSAKSAIPADAPTVKDGQAVRDPRVEVRACSFAGRSFAVRSERRTQERSHRNARHAELKSPPLTGEVHMNPTQDTGRIQPDADAEPGFWE